MARKTKSAKLAEGVPFLVEADQIEAASKSTVSRTIEQGERVRIREDESMVVSQEFEIQGDLFLEADSAFEVSMI